MSISPHLSAPSNAPSSSMTINPAGHAAGQASASANIIDLTGDDLPSQPGQSQDPTPEYALPKWQPDGDVQSCPVCGVEFTFWNRKHHCRYVSVYKHSVPHLLHRKLANLGLSENVVESCVAAAPPIA
jgi:hypothetical protein